MLSGKFFVSTLLAVAGASCAAAAPGSNETRAAQFDLRSATVSALSSKYGIPNIQFEWGYTAWNGQSFGYALQYLQDTDSPIVNAVGNVAFDSSGKVTAIASSFVLPKFIPSNLPNSAPAASIAAAEQATGAKYNNWPTTFQYYAQPDGRLSLVYLIQVQDDSKGIWKEVLVDTSSHEIIYTKDFHKEDAGLSRVSQGTYFG